MIVYIVDDDEHLLDVLSRAARKANYSVVTCINGHELATALKEQDKKPGLVVLDVHMADKDGIESIEDLVLHQDHVRVRFMTGGAESHVIAANMIAKSRGLNVGRSIFKPFDTRSFVDILHAEYGLLGGPAPT